MTLTRIGGKICITTKHEEASADLTPPTLLLDDPRLDTERPMTNYQSSPFNPQDSEIDIEDGPSLLVSSLDEFVLITFSEGDPGTPEFMSGQWVLSEQEAHRMAVALYRATPKAVS